MSEVKFFLESVWGSMEGNVILGLRDRPGPKGKVNRYYDWKYPEQFDEVIMFAEEHQNSDLYYSPLVYGEERDPETKRLRRTPENALTSLTVYQDSDTCTPDKFRLRPSVHVQTSSGRYQDSWVLTEPISAEDAATLSHKIAVAHKDDGSDPSSWSANKVLRIPHSFNTSHGFPESVTVEYSGLIYDDLDIAGAYDDVQLEKRAILRLPADVSFDSDMDLPDYADALDKLPEAFSMSLLTEQHKEGSDRSKMRYRLLCELFRAGTLTFEEALSLAWHAPVSRKWKEDSRNIRGLIAEALKAQAEVTYETGSGLVGPSFSERQELGEVGRENPHEWPKLLTDEERDSISGDENFISRYEQWCLAKQGRYYNAPYARMAAWQYLSAAFCDVGFIPRGNGPEYLNMFGMAIGDSGSGKTSSRKLWDIAMRELFEGDKMWDLGSNASPNALHEALLGRDGKFSSFSSDEAHGWFRQANGQQWSDGIYEALAKYYDGDVPPMLRTGNKEISGKSAKTYFNMYMMGTLKGEMSLAHVLTRSMFLSGLLARFVWCIGEEVEMTQESMQEEDVHSDFIRLGYDPVARQWAAEFNNTKKQLRAQHKRRAIPVNMTDEALRRMSVVKWEIVRMYRDDRNWEILEPALRNRFGPNIRKAASLLALEEGKQVAELRHVLLAIEAAEEWVNGVVFMADRISDSEWKRQTDEVLQFIGTKSRVSLESVNRRFDSRRMRDLAEQVESLKAQGRIMEKSESGRKFLVLNE